MRAPFDAVLLVSFGGPQGPDDIRPFLANVLRGRRIPAERIEEVAHHYELFGGVSPLTASTEAQADGLREALAVRGLPLPVYVGMRNWSPLLPDVLARMARDGVTRAIGVLAAAHRSYSSCGQYRDNVMQARETVAAAGHRPVDVTYVDDWHVDEGFLTAVVDHARAARAMLPSAHQATARLVFTAHSVPTSMPGAQTYHAQLRESAAAAATRLGVDDWGLVFQSRSGRPEDPWLEPDVNDYRPQPDRLRVRSHRGALRPRSRGARDVRRPRPADGACIIGERPSRVRGHARRRRRAHVDPLRTRHSPHARASGTPEREGTPAARDASRGTASLTAHVAAGFHTADGHH